MLKKRKTIFVTLSVLIGLIGGLLTCEFFVRIFYNPNHLKPRIPLGYGLFSADCYPTDPDHTFPIHLNQAPGLSTFALYFPDFSIYDKNLTALVRRSIDSRNYRSAASFVVTEAPHCVLYDHTSKSPRAIMHPDRFTTTIALIGDSFAYGQGVDEHSTYGHFLSKKWNARIINYSNIGANIREIAAQFRQAIADVGKYGFTKIIYLFVLNDPLITPELEKSQNYISDLMNYRRQKIPGRMEDNTNTLAHLRVFTFIRERLVKVRATQQTIQWYKDIYSEGNAAPLAETFQIIRSMKNTAESKKIRFCIVLYPLMAGFNNYPLESVHERIRELAASNDVNVLDLLPAFNAWPGQDFAVHPVDFHPNRAAHQVAAEATAQMIR